MKNTFMRILSCVLAIVMLMSTCCVLAFAVEDPIDPSFTRVCGLAGCKSTQWRSHKEAATCTHGDIIVYTCVKCGNKVNEPDGGTAALPHTKASETPIKTVPATCAEDGYKLFKCSVCGNNFKEVLPKLTGKNCDTTKLVIVKNSELTGQYCSVKKCPTCGKIFNGEGNYTKHDWIAYNSVAEFESKGGKLPECTENGAMVFYCKNCGDVRTFKIEASTCEMQGHNLVEHEENSINDWTCTVPLNRHYYECKDCGKYFKDKNATIEMKYGASENDEDNYIYRRMAVGHLDPRFVLNENKTAYVLDKNGNKQLRTKDGKVNIRTDGEGYIEGYNPAVASDCVKTGNYEYWVCMNPHCTGVYDKDGNTVGYSQVVFNENGNEIGKLADEKLAGDVVIPLDTNHAYLLNGYANNAVVDINTFLKDLLKVSVKADGSINYSGNSVAIGTGAVKFERINFPTCTQVGTAYLQCPNKCTDSEGKAVQVAVTIKKLGHVYNNMAKTLTPDVDYVAGSEVPADCTKAATYNFICQQCAYEIIYGENKVNRASESGKCQAKEVISVGSPLGHDWIAVNYATEYNCLQMFEEGKTYTIQVKCKSCGEGFDKQKDSGKKIAFAAGSGLSWGDGKTKYNVIGSNGAISTSVGVQDAGCVYYTFTYGKIGNAGFHCYANETEAYNPADCKTYECYWGDCRICSGATDLPLPVGEQKLADHPVDQLQLKKVAKAPTCTEAGIEYYLCTKCLTDITVTIPATGHKYSMTKVEREGDAAKNIQTYIGKYLNKYYADPTDKEYAKYKDIKLPTTGLTWNADEYNNESGKKVEYEWTITLPATCQFGEQTFKRCVNPWCDADAVYNSALVVTADNDPRTDFQIFFDEVYNNEDNHPLAPSAWKNSESKDIELCQKKDETKEATPDNLVKFDVAFTDHWVLVSSGAKNPDGHYKQYDNGEAKLSPDHEATYVGGYPYTANSTNNCQYKALVKYYCIFCQTPKYAKSSDECYYTLHEEKIGYTDVDLQGKTGAGWELKNGELHQWNVLFDEKLATCFTDGKAAVEICKQCKKQRGGEVTVKAFGHDVEKMEKAGGTYAENIYDGNHKLIYTKYVPHKDVTCTEDGNYAYYVCKFCTPNEGGATLNEDIVEEGKVTVKAGTQKTIEDFKIATDGHETSDTSATTFIYPVKWEAKGKVTNYRGGYFKICDRCGEVAEETFDPKCNFNAKHVAATCLTYGYDLYTCNGKCGDFHYFVADVTETGNGANHVFYEAKDNKVGEVPVYREADCLPGFRLCKTCGYLEVTEAKQNHVNAGGYVIIPDDCASNYRFKLVNGVKVYDYDDNGERVLMQTGNVYTLADEQKTPVSDFYCVTCANWFGEEAYQKQSSDKIIVRAEDDKGNDAITRPYNILSCDHKTLTYDASCVEAAYTVRVCKNCDDSRDKTIILEDNDTLLPVWPKLAPSKKNCVRIMKKASEIDNPDNHNGTTNYNSYAGDNLTLDEIDALKAAGYNVVVEGKVATVTCKHCADHVYTYNVVSGEITEKLDITTEYVPYIDVEGTKATAFVNGGMAIYNIYAQGKLDIVSASLILEMDKQFGYYDAEEEEWVTVYPFSVATNAEGKPWVVAGEGFDITVGVEKAGQIGLFINTFNRSTFKFETVDVSEKVLVASIYLNIDAGFYRNNHSIRTDLNFRDDYEIIALSDIGENKVVPQGNIKLNWIYNSKGEHVSNQNKENVDYIRVQKLGDAVDRNDNGALRSEDWNTIASNAYCSGVADYYDSIADVNFDGYVDFLDLDIISKNIANDNYAAIVGGAISSGNVKPQPN